jgi:hypothetical protein
MLVTMKPLPSLLFLALATQLFGGALTVTLAPTDLVGAPGHLVFQDGTISNGTAQTIFFQDPGFGAAAIVGYDTSVILSSALDLGVGFLNPLTGTGLAPGTSYSGHILDFLIQPNPPIDFTVTSMSLFLGPHGVPGTQFMQNGSITVSPEPGTTVEILGGLALIALQCRRLPLGDMAALQRRFRRSR